MFKKMFDTNGVPFPDLIGRVLLAFLAAGAILAFGVVFLFNFMSDAKPSQVGITVITKENRQIRIDKGTLINGSAYEPILFGSKTEKKQIKTPFITDRAMSIRTDSICIVYPSDDYIKYSPIVDKLLK